MRFEEKIAFGKVGRFAVVFGRQRYRAAVMEAARLGVRDVFFFSDPSRSGYPRKLHYFDYELIDFAELDRRDEQRSLSDAWIFEEYSKEGVAVVEATWRENVSSWNKKLFDADVCVELELPYRLGPLAFLQGTGANNRYWARIGPETWQEHFRPHLDSVANRLGTQVVFVPEFRPCWVIAAAVPEGVRVLDSNYAHQGRPLETADWAKGLINLVAPGNTWMNRFCVCDLEKEQVLWVRFKRGQ